jgi:hypothetical protein
MLDSFLAGWVKSMKHAKRCWSWVPLPAVGGKEKNSPSAFGVRQKENWTFFQQLAYKKLLSLTVSPSYHFSDDTVNQPLLVSKHDHMRRNQPPFSL